MTADLSGYTLDSSAVELSVVVPCTNTLGDLERTLRALERERDHVGLEIIAVNRIGLSVSQVIRERHPSVRLIEAAETVAIPAMRRIAFAAARGEFIAVIEDHVTVPPGWARALLDAGRTANRLSTHRGAVVGGSVANAATSTVVDWAAFLCEYSHCLTPLHAGASTWLTGNNVAYPRALLLRYLAQLPPDGWENRLHELMIADGVQLIMHPEISVDHEKHYSALEYLTQRYLYARSFAGARVAGRPVRHRVVLAILAVALPPLLLGRLVARVFGKRRHRVLLLRSLPLLTLFVCAWAAGEMIGYGLGAGDSLARVR